MEPLVETNSLVSVHQKEDCVCFLQFSPDTNSLVSIYQKEYRVCFIQAFATSIYNLYSKVTNNEQYIHNYTNSH